MTRPISSRGHGRVGNAEEVGPEPVKISSGVL